VLAANHTDDVMHGGMAVATMAAAESTGRRNLILSDTESRVLDTLAAMNLTSLEQSRGDRRDRSTPADQASGASLGRLRRTTTHARTPGAARRGSDKRTH
jgi:hypothetical protein